MKMPISTCIALFLLFGTECFSLVAKSTSAFEITRFWEADESYADSYFIDSYDSLIFNFSKATINGIYVEFPISFVSDDSIHAVDFSFKYNIHNVEFDSILNLTPGLQYLYHYNITDSTLRFTSNSLNVIPSDSDIVILRFKTFNGQMCANDLDSVLTYLNGDDCSYQLYGCIISGDQEIQEPNISLTLLPNPASSEISFQIKQGNSFDEIRIFNTKGELMKVESIGIYNTIDIELLVPGLYFLEMLNKKSGERKCAKFVKSGSL